MWTTLSEGVRRLYWVGGAVHPDSGLLTTLEAVHSATVIIGQD